MYQELNSLIGYEIAVVPGAASPYPRIVVAYNIDVFCKDGTNWDERYVNEVRILCSLTDYPTSREDLIVVNRSYSTKETANDSYHAVWQRWRDQHPESSFDGVGVSLTHFDGDDCFDDHIGMETGLEARVILFNKGFFEFCDGYSNGMRVILNDRLPEFAMSRFAPLLAPDVMGMVASDVIKDYVGPSHRYGIERADRQLEVVLVGRHQSQLRSRAFLMPRHF